MNNLRRNFAAILVGLWALGSAQAQLPTSVLHRVEPFSAKSGDVIDMVVAGENLRTVTGLRFTHPGIVAEPVMLAPEKDLPARPAPLKFSVKVAEEVPPGIYEVRTIGSLGISTSRPFLIVAKDSPEIAEAKDHATMDKAMQLKVNSFVSGMADSRNADWYKISAAAGQRILVELIAQRLDSRLDGKLAVYDANGRRLQENRDWFGRDSFLEISAETAGDYYLAVSDILYRGGPEYFYRLSVSDRPQIDFVYPPAGLPGSREKYRIYGRNLPSGSRSEGVTRHGKSLESMEVEIQLPDEPQLSSRFFPGTPRQGLLPTFDFQWEQSSPVRIGFATAPVALETSSEAKQYVNVPAEIAGCFSQPNEVDTYYFEAIAGQVYCVETIADRMESIVDTMLAVYRVEDVEGQEQLTRIVDNDDLGSFYSVDGNDTLNADTVDSFVSFTAEHEGTYAVTVSNQYGDGDCGKLYRLAIRQPTPDFQVIAATERPLATGRAGYSVTPLLRQGGRWGVRILVPRQDNFEGEIVITAEDLPPGVSAKPLVLSADTDRGFLILSATMDAPSWAGAIRIVGRAKVGEKELVRPAKFAMLTWSHVFADSFQVRSRLDTEIPLAVIDQEKTPAILSVAGDQEWTVEMGKSLEIPLTVQTVASRIGDLTVEPRGLFGMLRSPPTANISEQSTEAKLTINFTRNGNFTVKPGRYQFALHGTGVTKYGYQEPNSDKVTEKEEKFSTWSELITVNVIEPEKK